MNPSKQKKLNEFFTKRVKFSNLPFTEDEFEDWKRYKKSKHEKMLEKIGDNVGTR